MKRFNWHKVLLFVAATFGPGGTTTTVVGNDLVTQLLGAFLALIGMVAGILSRASQTLPVLEQISKAIPGKQPAEPLPPA